MQSQRQALANRADRERLLRLYPYCHLCACEVVPPAGNGRQSRDTATVDHVYSRNDWRRYQPGGGEIVLACFACNQARNTAEMVRGRHAAVPGQWRRARAKGWPPRIGPACGEDWLA